MAAFELKSLIVGLVIVSVLETASTEISRKQARQNTSKESLEIHAKKPERCVFGADCDKCSESRVRWYHVESQHGEIAGIKLCCSGCSGQRTRDNDKHIDQFCSCPKINEAPKFKMVVSCLIDEDCDLCDLDAIVEFDDETGAEPFQSCCPKCAKQIRIETDALGTKRCLCWIPDGIEGDCWKGIQCKKCKEVDKSIHGVPVCCQKCTNSKIEINTDKKDNPSCNCYRLLDAQELSGFPMLDI